jgi:hypothetical protein
VDDKLERIRVEVTKKIDDTSRDHKAELTDLRRQFETLEAGRLTRAEGNIQDLRLAYQALNDITSSTDKSLSNKFVVIGSIGMVILSTFLSALFIWLFRGMK